ncbi:general stress protein [Thalassorhabdus alkalitolerans]|uniref:General stress protein n=1 Tax=Thalassorhabdus alkalitolerans TaxID=2282697 RepID=A0ABW0YHZ9_9BACI
MDKKIIGGVFRNEQDAVNAIEGLEKNGYNKDDISIFVKNDEDADAIEDKTDANVTDNADDNNRGKGAGKGLGIGAGSGAVLGGIAGLGVLAIPGIGPIAAVGPIAAAIEGGAIGAAGGGIVGALTGAGIPEEEAKEYDKYLEEGNILVLVEADEKQESSVYDTFTTHNTVNTDMYPDYAGRDKNNF